MFKSLHSIGVPSPVSSLYKSRSAGCRNTNLSNYGEVYATPTTKSDGTTGVAARPGLRFHLAGLMLRPLCLPSGPLPGQ